MNAAQSSVAPSLPVTLTVSHRTAYRYSSYSAPVDNTWHLATTIRPPECPWQRVFAPVIVHSERIHSTMPSYATNFPANRPAAGSRHRPDKQNFIKLSGLFSQ